ncbi:MAG: GspH/FimT family pseudopilin [Pseudohongiella sp.]|nr:GspH/FimT family pseudopilin [Pseudohongiella sp.]MDO9521771.1 GspH/FimT family pseudopilin [Pseudohongiella sp.]MDP2128383.1 GspH/FimT family pseudopilin [Pseudohongiella sp.]
MKNPQPRLRKQGYTLLELLITVAIITILATLSLPALYPPEQKEAEQVFVQMGALVSAARAAAIDRHISVVICPTDNMESCSNDWNTGVLVFIDNNQNRQLDQSESIIERSVWGGAPSASSNSLRGTLHWRVFGNRQSIYISPLGEISDQNGNLTWCPPSGSSVTPHQMVLNSSGRIRLAVDQNGDGLREDSQGRPISC